MTSPRASSILWLAAFLLGGSTTAQAGWPQRINDTGLTTCYAGAGDINAAPTPCSSSSWPGQDGVFGRDAAGASLPRIGAGAAGFDFSKLSTAGALLPATAGPGSGPNDWACTRDNATGLVWRIAVTAAQSWGGAQARARELNLGGGLCGFSDWRVPTSDELLGIVHFGHLPPAVDTNYFPFVQSGFHWTADIDPAAPMQRARIVNFAGGFVHAIAMTAPAAVLLVRGGDSFPAFIDNGNGTVTDPRTGLMWDRCALDQDLAGGCSGEPGYYTWQAALQEVAVRNGHFWRGSSGWRLPNAKELATLVRADRHHPAIDSQIFPNSAAVAHWTSTTKLGVLRMAWAVFFGDGNLFAKDKATRAAVRLVRDANAAAAGAARDALFADGFDVADLPAQLPADELPTVTITTDNGAPIDHDIYVTATLDISATPQSPQFSGTLQIKGRGNSTWGMPKKPYRIKLDSKAPLLGMNQDKNWALLANYADKSLLRNRIGQDLGQQLGMAWNPDSRMVKLILNGQYKGVYQLIETIRVSGDRVDITEMEPTDVNPPEVTGGYLFEIDKRRDCAANVLFETSRGVPFCIDTPDEDEIVPQQYAWLSGYVQASEDAIYAPDFSDPVTGYRAWLDPDSFIDWYLINELFANVDAQDFSSIWNYKDRNGLMRRGPLWDFDLGIGNANYRTCADPQGFWVHDGTWYERLFQDPAFAAQTRARWDALKPGVFDQLPALVDAEAAAIHGAIGDNFVRWPILRDYVWPNVVVTGSWEGEIAYDKDWLLQRVAWLDANL